MADFLLFKCPYISKTQIICSVEDFRQKYWPDNSFPVNMEKIIESGLKIDIVPERYVDQFNIDAFLNLGCSSIVVSPRQYMDNNDRYANRLRFSFAHEVGHYVLHKKIYEEMNFNNEYEYTDFIQGIDEKEYKFFEGQANYFVGNLLVPRYELSLEINKIMSNFEIDPVLSGILIENPAQALEGVSSSISKKFGVSDEVIIRRANDEKLWPPA